MQYADYAAWQREVLDEGARARHLAYWAQQLQDLAALDLPTDRRRPEVPTLQESGFPGVSLESWYAAFVPLGTPAGTIARLNAVMNKALADTGTREQFGKSATEPAGGSAEDLARVARADFNKYARLVKELNIRAS